jgi:hypothetical protein
MSSAYLTQRTVRYNSVGEIENAIVDFEACRIPKEAWTYEQTTKHDGL